MRKNIFIFIFLILFNLILRWNSFTTPFERDEGEYAYGARVITQGGFPYKDTFLQKPPLIIYTYLLGEVITPGAIWFPRLLAFIFGIATALILGLTAKKLLGSNGFWPAVFIFPTIALSPINSGLAANCEIFMLLPLSGLLYLSLSDLSQSKNWLFSGMLASLSILYKPICLYLVIGVLVVSMIQIIKTGMKLQTILKLLIFYLLGLLILSAIIFTPVYLEGSFPAMWEQVIVFNSLYAQHWGLSLLSLGSNLKIMAKSFWFVYLVIILGLGIKKVPKYFYLYFLLGLLAVFQTTIRHYYLLVVPVVVLIVTLVVQSVKEKKWRLVIYGGIFISILWPIRQQFALAPEDLSLWIYGRENPFYESQLASAKLINLTNEKDCVFIAGSEPQILYYAKRRSCTRFNITYPLIINTSKRLDYQKQAIEDLKANRPSAIVFPNRIHSGLWNSESPKDFINFLNALIKKEYRLAGAYVWGVRGGAWVEKLVADDINMASLVLYKKR